jgi:hypothetical protein
MMNAGPCYRCKADISLPDELYHAARRSPAINFWCAYGHEQHFTERESEESKLRRERDRLLQRQAELNDEIRDERARAVKAEKKAARTLKRATAALCPCCNRHFSNVARHMKTKHRDVVALPVRKDLGA